MPVCVKLSSHSTLWPSGFFFCCCIQEFDQNFLLKCLYIVYELFQFDFIAIVWYIASSQSYSCSEMSAHIPADTKLQHPPQQQSVHPAAVWQKTQVSTAITPDYRAASFHRMGDSSINLQHSNIRKKKLFCRIKGPQLAFCSTTLYCKTIKWTLNLIPCSLFVSF